MYDSKMKNNGRYDTLEACDLLWPKWPWPYDLNRCVIGGEVHAYTTGMTTCYFTSPYNNVLAAVQTQGEWLEL